AHAVGSSGPVNSRWLDLLTLSGAPPISNQPLGVGHSWQTLQVDPSAALPNLNLRDRMNLPDRRPELPHVVGVLRVEHLQPGDPDSLGPALGECRPVREVILP